MQEWDCQQLVGRNRVCQVALPQWKSDHCYSTPEEQPPSASPPASCALVGESCQTVTPLLRVSQPGEKKQSTM